MQCDAPRHCHRGACKERVKAQGETRVRCTKIKNAKLPEWGAFIGLIACRGTIFTGRAAANARHFPRSYRSREEKSFARTPPEASGETPFHPFYTNLEASRGFPGGSRGGPEVTRNDF